MYVVTFYSFKGGVGRTYALVNVGVELAKTGRKVLLVDFDLEAPGVSTFDLLRPATPNRGVVGYVSDYLAQRAAPDVREFVYEVPGIGGQGGRLWVMPAGAGDNDFHDKLAGLNWQELYARHDGYAMMQDMKGQWEKELAPDYVLVDSRTGYTDVQGICTRQLPDAVVVMFFPNEQNLAGLKTVVDDIRTEPERVERPPVHLHFVASNVPFVDDEEDILASRLRQFEDELGFKKADCVVHRYDSLLLLNQTVFVHERPKSRPARQYKELKGAIVEANFQDRDAAIKFLDKLTKSRSLSARGRSRSVEDRISYILERHAEDGDILTRLATLAGIEGRTEDALTLVARAIDQGVRSFPTLVRRLELLLQLDRHDEALTAFQEVLRLPDLGAVELARLIRLSSSGATTQGAAERLFDVVGGSRAFASLDTASKLFAIGAFRETPAGLEVAVKLLGKLLTDRKVSLEEHAKIRSLYVACLIGLGRLEDARSEIRTANPRLDFMPAELAFHYGMAGWASTGQFEVEPFRRFLSESADEKSSDPGHYQRRAIAQLIVGDTVSAQKSIGEALQGESHLRRGFNYWRYRIGSISEFMADCRQLHRAIADGTTVGLRPALERNPAHDAL